MRSRAESVPVFATLLVALAVAAMVALGLWQLHRLSQKEALLARYAANVSLPPVAMPSASDDTLLFRRATVTCDGPVSFTSEGGRNARGGTGWRQIARCGDGSGVAVQLGLSPDPHARPAWTGGAVRGYLTHAPDHAPLIAGLFGGGRAELMLVADPPLAGFEANPQPDLSAVPNNHLAYAVQWFAFAAIATVIYALALRRRMVAAIRSRR